ncbi:MAG: galactitol system component [Chloroflexota bacterium]|nr:galactitol system component [Chloroflexota bacterium]
MADLYFDENLVEINLVAQHKEEIIHLLSNKLEKKGFVEPGFEKAVLAREECYPTGLPTRVPVALCHVEAEYVKRTTMSLAVLSSPVQFHDMGNPDNVLDVEIVFLLTILDPKQQVVYLRRLMELFKDDTLYNLKTAKTRQEVVSILLNKIQNW